MRRQAPDTPEPDRDDLSEIEDLDADPADAAKVLGGLIDPSCEPLIDPICEPVRPRP